MTILRNVALIIIIAGLFLGVRFIGATIHYGCHPDRIVNTDDGDDCAPPIVGIGEISFYLTGGSFNPISNKDAITVRKVSWRIERANPAATSDDFRYYEQTIAADVTTFDGITQRYDLGTAYGCTGTETSELEVRKIVIGRVACTFAESGTRFSAFKYERGFAIERYDESSKDGSIRTTTLLEIP